MKKSLLSLGLAFIMCSFVLLNGCGSTDSKNTSKPTVSSDIQSSVSTLSSETNKYDPFGKYSQTVTITGVLNYGAPSDPTVPKDITPENMSFIKAAKDRMNIEFKWLWEVPTSQFAQKLGVAIASGELPDVLTVNAAQYQTLKENNQLADLTEAVKYESSDFKNWFERDSSIIQKIKKMSGDGKLYAIPQYANPLRNLTMMYIRRDWLNELNLSVPKTMDELKNVAKQFVEKKGSYGIGVGNQLSSWGFDIQSYMYGFGSYPTSWILGNDGKLVPGLIQPKTKNALSFLSDMYNENLIYKEFATIDSSKVAQQIIDGKIGIVTGAWWLYEYPLNQAKDKDPKNDWVCAQIPGTSEGSGKAILNRASISTYTVVNKNCKNPEAVVKLFNLSTDFLVNNPPEADPKNGYVYEWIPTFYYDPYDINTTFETFNKAIELNPNEKKPAGMTKGDLDGMWKYVPEYLNWKAGKGQFDGEHFGSLMSRVDKDLGWGTTLKIAASGKTAYNEFYGAPTPTMVQKGSSLNDMTQQTFIKIIMGAAPVSDFDKFVSSWKKLGGDNITQEVNDWYIKNKE